MTINFTNEERQYLTNHLLNPDVTSPQYDNVDVRRALAASVKNVNHDYTTQEVGILQCILQEQSEIYGRTSTTANEKQPVSLASFSMQKQVSVIKSAAAKLGATLYNNQPPSIPNSPRGEGSISIMIDPLQVK